MVYKYSKKDFSTANAAGSQPVTANADAGRLAGNANRENKIIRWEDAKWETIPLNWFSSAIGGQEDIKRHNENKEKRKSANPTRHFGHLCNAYAKYINKKYHQRHGSLFQRPFRRKLVEDERYLKQLVLYIHNNAVHH